jgi:hypothetical protein
MAGKEEKNRMLPIQPNFWDAITSHRFRPSWLVDFLAMVEEGKKGTEGQVERSLQNDTNSESPDSGR